MIKYDNIFKVLLSELLKTILSASQFVSPLTPKSNFPFTITTYNFTSENFSYTYHFVLSFRPSYSIWPSLCAGAVPFPGLTDQSSGQTQHRCDDPHGT